MLPKAIYYQRTLEKEFYQEFFSRVRHWARSDPSLLEAAFQYASRDGLNAMDALQVAAAVALNADELVTTEKASKTIHRTQAIRVWTIRR